MIHIEHRGETMIVSLSKELDQHYAGVIRNRIDSEYFLSSAKNILLDFSMVTFMDSSGIGMVMGRYKNTLKRNGRIAMICKNDKIRSIMALSGVFKFVQEYDSIDSAFIALN